MRYSFKTYENTPENATSLGWPKVEEHCVGNKECKYVSHNTNKGKFIFHDGRVHIIFNPLSKFYIETVPYVVNDGDLGLPRSFFFDSDGKFRDNRDNFEYDLVTGLIEWVPAIGPAPCFLYQVGAMLDPKKAFEDAYPRWSKWLSAKF